MWCQLDVLVPAFTGSTTVAVPVPCSYDLELAAAKYLHSLPDGEAPLALHFNGTIYYPGDDGGCRWCWCRGPSRSTSGCRCRCGARRSSTTTRQRLGRAALRDARSAPAVQARPRAGDARRDRLGAARRGSLMALAAQLEALVDSLLCEGYALYPYTPGATKNATPTPFGIVYPPVYARALASTYRPPASCAASSRRRPTRCWSAEVRFLASGAERHQARRADAVAGGGDGRRARGAAGREAGVSGARAGPPLVIGLRLGPRARARPVRGRAARREPDRRLERARPRRRARALAALHPSAAARRPAAASSRRSSARTRASTPSRCSRRRPTTPCSARRSCCPTTRRSRPRAAAACSTRPRSRRRCCCTSRSLTDDERAEIEQPGPGGPGDDRPSGRGDARGHHRAARAHELRDPQTDEPPRRPRGCRTRRAGEETPTSAA